MVVRRRDAASTHVLEAMVLTCVMLGSIAFVVTYDLPPTDSGAPRAALGQRVRDVLAIMNDTPVDDSDLGDNVLSVSLLECLQRDCDRLKNKMEDLLPVGTQYAVYLSTGEGLYPVYAPRSPAGEAVTHRRLIEPAWSYLFVAVSQSMVNPVEDPLVVYGLPVVSANPVHQGGSALSITAYGTRDSDKAAFVLKTSATTRAVTTADVPTPPGISIWFHDGDGEPAGTREVTAQSIDLAGLPTYTPIRFGLRLSETGGGIIPEGTIATIAMPHGWNGSAPQDDNDDWLVLRNATDSNGTSDASTVSAKLLHDVADTVDLWLDGNYTGGVEDYYAFTATLTAGAYARAAMLVRADEHATVSAFEVPALVASVPRPMGVGATTTWTLAAFTSDAIDIDRIEIVEEEGREIFADADAVSGGGTWTALGHRLVWEGPATIEQDAPLDLVFEVESSEVRGPPTDRAPFTPSVEIDDYSGALAHELSPGLHAGVFLPAWADAKGYDTEVSGLVTEHPIDSDSVYRTTALPGSTEYSIGLALGLDDSLFGSTIELDRRHVNPGGSVGVTVETQSVLYRLAALGIEPTVELNVYPPWTGDDRDAIAREDLYDAELASGVGTFLELIDTDDDGVPDETDVGRLETTIDVPTYWLYGSYIVEAKISWFEDLGAGDITRDAYLYDYFVVRPTDGALPSSPVYDVHLVAWQGDWG